MPLAPSPFWSSLALAASSLASQPLSVEGHASLRCPIAFDRNESTRYLVASLRIPETTRKSTGSLFPNAGPSYRAVKRFATSSEES